MINYLEKILCVEVIEKILRMKRFLDPEPLHPYSHGADIISTFLKALNATTKNVNILAQRARPWATPGRGKSALPPEGAREVVPMFLVIEQVFLF